MKKLSKWLSGYSMSHQNLFNKKIHKVTAPGIFVALVGLIWSLPTLEIMQFSFNWLWLFAGGVLVFYYKLSIMVFIMMLGFILASSALIWSISILQVSTFHLSLSFLALFWLVQLIGYKIEGVMPSFKQRLEFVLIGPIWAFYKQ